MNAHRIILACLVAGISVPTLAAELHVATNGDDQAVGAASSPLRTIQRAADLAQPGDTITVHEGVYRERVNPPRGGESDARRIVYQAAPGARVEIKGSEVVTGWTKVQDEVWKVALPNTFFGDFNPFDDLIRGDWFNPLGRKHHTGAVYLNGDWLTEAATLDEVLLKTRKLNSQLWFARVDDEQTTIWAQFDGVDPNEHLVEVNVRQSVFYPDRPGRNFITVRGFTMRHAATPWAPPTAEQIGLLGTHWSKGWVIEGNVISHSVCTGVTLGKHGDKYDNTSADTAEGYVKTIERAHAFSIPWTKENIGHHVVRNNTISHCEQAGLVGSLGAAFSTIEGNVIHDIHLRRLFTGAEMSGIKIHAAIDTTIRRNHIYRCCMGLWLDWMAQGTRVSGNLFHDNTRQDLFVEVDHGPFVVDNNLFLSTVSLLDMSEGGAYVHNLFAGKLVNRPEPNRETPYHPAHTTDVAGLAVTTSGDDRFYNNVFVGNGETPSDEQKGNLTEVRWISGYGLWGYNGRKFPLQTGGNVYCFGAESYAQESKPTVRPDDNPNVRLVAEGEEFFLTFEVSGSPATAETNVVTTKLLGKSRVAQLPYENPDGTALTIDTDFFGKARTRSKPMPGPFADLTAGPMKLRVW